MIKRFVSFAVLIFAFATVNANISLSYQKGTGGPSGTGRAETECTPAGCTTNCSSGHGSCFSSASHNQPCPTYESVLAACPGAGKVWLNHQINSEVANIWNSIEEDILTGSYIKTYTNLVTNETVTVTFTWAPRFVGSDIFDITIAFN